MSSNQSLFDVRPEPNAADPSPADLAWADASEPERELARGRARRRGVDGPSRFFDAFARHELLKLRERPEPKRVG